MKFTHEKAKIGPKTAKMEVKHVILGENSPF